MKILIVGGAGYIGGALTDILKDSNHEIMIYDFLLYEEMYRKAVPFVYGDIRDYKNLKTHLDWADVVVWLAALVGDPACALDESLTKKINNDARISALNSLLANTHDAHQTAKRVPSSDDDRREMSVNYDGNCQLK